MNDKGKVTQVKGQIIEVEFLGDKPSINDLLIHEEDKSLILEVFSSSTNNRFFCLSLTDSSKLRRGSILINTGKTLSVPATEKALGRVFDVFGTAHDGGEDVKLEPQMEIFSNSNEVTHDNIFVHKDILRTGIKAIDFFTPIILGGRAGLFGGAGVGKTVLLTELINNIVIAKSQKKENKINEKAEVSSSDQIIKLKDLKTVSVFAAVGERSREAQELLETLRETKVLPYVSLILGQMGENPAVRFRTAFAAAAMAEYFRDVHEKDVLFFMDNVYRFAQAGYEIATLMNMLPSEDGYQPTLNSELGALHERLVSTKKASITVIEAIFVPSDDVTDYGVRSIFPFLGTSVVMSREVYQQGRYPAIDFLQSNSSALNPDIIGEKHYETYLNAKNILEKASKIERIASLVGEHELSAEDQIVFKRTKILRNYMTQAFHVVEAQSGMKGSTVQIEDVVLDVEKILNGEVDNQDPRKFLFIGRLEEGLQK
jgi:F-type H+/Na+-transporting ATPase subunit beta